MAKSVRDLPEEIHALIEVREWDMHSAESRAYFKTAQVRKLPSIAIGGRMAFEALIPDSEELIAEIMHCRDQDRKGA